MAYHAYDRLNLFMSMIYSACQMPIWAFGPSEECFYSTCLHQEIFLAQMKTTGLLNRIVHHDNPECPQYMQDTLGMIYGMQVCESDGFPMMVVIGPFFDSTEGFKSAQKRLMHMNLSVPVRRRLVQTFMSLPIIPIEMGHQYMRMLNFCITGEADPTVSPLGNTFLTSLNEDSMPEKTSASVEERLLLENDMNTRVRTDRILAAVTEGDLSIMDHMQSGEVTIDAAVGYSEPENPRIQKDEAIIHLEQATQAAIRGGLAVDTAERMRSGFVEQIEAARGSLEIFHVMEKLLRSFITAVRDLKRENSMVSEPVQRAMEYIRRNITREFELSDVAKAVGYADYYLTRKFHNETGIKMSDYVKQQKIELAKVWLLESNREIQDISDELNFQTRSYFSRVFRSMTGQTPSEFRRRARIRSND